MSNEQHAVESDAPRIITEYAFRGGKTIVSGPHTNPMWNEQISLEEAAQRWFKGAEVVTRTRTIYPDVVTDWEPVTSPGASDPKVPSKSEVSDA